MSTFAARCGLADPPHPEEPGREAAVQEVLRAVRTRGLQRVRIGWCDTHGVMRGKTLMPHALQDALDNGVGLVGTMLLKDTSDRTAWPVFDAAVKDQLWQRRHVHRLLSRRHLAGQDSGHNLLPLGV